MSLEKKVSEKEFNEIVNISSMIELVENMYTYTKDLSKKKRKKTFENTVHGYIAKEYRETLKVLGKYKEYRQGKNLKERLVVSYRKLLSLF